MENIKVGESAYLEKIFLEQDVVVFSKLSMDTNPIHLDHDYAKNTIFKNNIVHGFLVGSLISAVIGTILPGPGAIYLHQDLNFKRPVYIGEKVKATVTIDEIRQDKPIIRMYTVCTNERSEVVVDGYAIIKYK